MANLDISGKVFYAPGPWGIAVPVIDSSIRVFDRDLPGKGDDLILETKTNSEGRFAGETADWRDRLGPIPDPTDAAMFSVEVTGRQGQTFTAPPLPVPTLFGTLALPPTVVPWAPGDPVIVDGKTCWTPLEVFEAVAERAFGKHQAFEMVVPASVAPAVAAMMDSPGKRGSWVAEHMPGAAPFFAVIEKHTAPADSGAIVELTAGSILAIAVLVFGALTGLAILTVAVGVSVSLVLALALGYDVDFESDQSGSADGQANQKFKLKFRRPSST